MKKSIFILYILAFAVFSAKAQTIRRVNNTPGLTGVNIYTTAQAAHDAAAVGDVIYLEPGAGNYAADYGNLDVTKQIQIVGNGYFLDKNTNTAYDRRGCYLLGLKFKTGSANSTISGVSVNGAVYILCNNITITRSKISGITFGSDTPTGPHGNFANINKSVINGQITAKNGYADGGNNCSFSNNLIATVYSYIGQGLTNSIFNNNTVVPSAYGQYGSCLSNFISCTVTNNIFDLRNTAPATGLNSIAPASNVGTTYSNNVCVGYVGLPTSGVGNSGNVNSASISNFYIGTNTPIASYYVEEDGLLKLSATNPYLTMASDGGQPGAYGNGTNAYRLSGEPAFPIFTNVTTSGVGNTSTPLSVTVTVRGNN